MVAKNKYKNLAITYNIYSFCIYLYVGYNI